MPEHRYRCSQRRKAFSCLKMACGDKNGVGVDLSVGRVASEGGEPPLPTLVCVCVCVFFLWSGKKACEKGAHTGMKKLLEEIHLSCFPLQLGPLALTRRCPWPETLRYFPFQSSPTTTLRQPQPAPSGPSERRSPQATS